MIPRSENHDDVTREPDRLDRMTHHALHIPAESRSALRFQIDEGNEEKRCDERRGDVQDQSRQKPMLPEKPKRDYGSGGIRSEFQRMDLVIQNSLAKLHFSLR